MRPRGRCEPSQTNALGRNLRGAVQGSSEPDGESASDVPSDDDGSGNEFEIPDNPTDLDELANLIRPDLVTRVVEILTADAERADGELKRADIDRILSKRTVSGRM